MQEIPKIHINLHKVHTFLMHTYVKTLQRVAKRFGPSRMLSYDTVHVFKTLQLIEENGHVSREILCKELELGEGTVKTLMRHLKTQDLIESTKAGTRMTRKGNSFFTELQSSMPFETSLSKCTITLGKHNYAILVKQMRSAIRSGIEQRDDAIKMGASGATTLLYQNNKFLIPQTNFDALKDESQLSKQLIENLHPHEEDVVIIGTDNSSKKRAEFAAKNAALITIMAHEKH
jgi:Mn-dependent DtxR family transcriptional regulator